MTKIICKSLFILLTIFTIQAKGKIVSIGNYDAKLTIKVFSSLTCPACANFHSKIFYNLKKDFIDKNLVRFEHHPFPLDLAALNAEIILRCDVDEEKSFELLGKIYEKQDSSCPMFANWEKTKKSEKTSIKFAPPLKIANNPPRIRIIPTA